MEYGRLLMNPKTDEKQMYRAFCLLGEHDAPRISYIYLHMDKYDFRAVRFLCKIFNNFINFAVSDGHQNCHHCY